MSAKLAPSPRSDPASSSALVGVAGGDLMAVSRVAAVASRGGWRTEPVAGFAAALSCRLLVLDLNREVEGGLALLRRLSDAPNPPPVICVGAHVEVARWRAEARRLGAAAVTVNSKLPGLLLRHLEQLGWAQPSR